MTPASTAQATGPVAHEETVDLSENLSREDAEPALPPSRTMRTLAACSRVSGAHGSKLPVAALPVKMPSCAHQATAS